MNMQDETDEQILGELDAADEYVRAAAAVELVRRGHPQALAACLRTLNDAAEFTHSYSTPAVWQLVGFGAIALTPLLKRLTEQDVMTRLRAAYAIMEITKRQFGFDGHQWPEGTYDRWAQWWMAIGYAYDMATPTRAAALQRLRTACAAWMPSGAG
jgi:hypothetical protein